MQRHHTTRTRRIDAHRRPAEVIEPRRAAGQRARDGAGACVHHRHVDVLDQHITIVPDERPHVHPRLRALHGIHRETRVLERRVGALEKHPLLRVQAGGFGGRDGEEGGVEGADIGFDEVPFLAADLGGCSAQAI